MSKIDLNNFKGDYDWTEAISVASGSINAVQGSSCSTAPFTIDDVVEILAAREGYNDGDPWLCIVKLVDGRYAFVSAGCDYTGWDCQAGGCAFVSDDWWALIWHGLGEGDRADLGFDSLKG